MQTFLHSLVKKKLFNRICVNNGIELSFEINQSELGILKNIFVDREYADYFPFYQKNTIVDAGAHYGYFSLFAAINSAPESKVFSIEASPENLDAMKSNFQYNPALSLVPIHAALSDKNGVVELLKGRKINNSIISNPLLSSSEKRTVPAISLDHLLKQWQLEKVDFLKMDIEGAEYQVLHATSEETFQKIKVISLEFHDLKSAHHNGQSLMSLLQRKDYTVVRFHHEPSNFGLNYGKIIAIRQ